MPQTKQAVTATGPFVLEIDGQETTVRQLVGGQFAGLWWVEEILPGDGVPFLVGFSMNSLQEAAGHFKQDLRQCRQRAANRQAGDSLLTG